MPNIRKRGTERREKEWGVGETKKLPIRLMVLLRLNKVGIRQQTTDLNDCDCNEVLRTETNLDELNRN